MARRCPPRCLAVGLMLHKQTGRLPAARPDSLAKWQQLLLEETGQTRGSCLVSEAWLGRGSVLECQPHQCRHSVLQVWRGTGLPRRRQ
mmetsp:Transcript_3518/g.9583  ORF Transcript_3518/g.9583 Transcript_3518/m.9583 type:complete len:88 (+) Transcript_3518:377-640(+)